MDPSILPFVKEWGPATLVTLFVVLLFTGRLIPKRTVDSQLEAERQKTEIWKQIAETRKQELDARSGIAPAQLESARVVEQVMLALKAQASAEEPK